MSQVANSRRWPPIAAVGVALVMVFLVLPNPLRIPNQNPTATAEYAPVPGKSEQADNGNFSETGEATSPGIGAGNSEEGALPGSFQPPPPQFKPRDKACVGNPPRQTEDPLSPPCVSFFEGDNGGATFHGVTRDEITVIFYNQVGVTGDLNKPWKPSDEPAGHQGSLYGQATYLRRTVKALLRYFQHRYQTYGRTVRLFGQSSAGGECGPQQQDADIGAAQWDAYANVFLGDSNECYGEQMARKHKILSFGLNSDVRRDIYEGNRPYIWGFFPDQEAESEWSASFICRKLYYGEDGPGSRGVARIPMTKDPLLVGDVRKFGFIRPDSLPRSPAFKELSELLVRDLKRLCPRTENEYVKKNWFDNIRIYEGAGAAAGAREAPDIMREFKTQGITTVVCYCVPVPGESTVSTMQNAAASIGYTPEWYWDHGSRMFRAVWNQLHGDPKQPGFGVNHHWRNPAFHQQYWYQAYLEEEPGTRPNARFGFDIYHLFLNLFQAIQAAGPILTPESTERGMFTFHYLNRRNPFIPLGGYGPYSSKDIKAAQAIAPFNFVDTAMGWWWDPTGTPPGGKRGEGCIRVMDQGIRYFAEEWPYGDRSLFTSNAPCSQDDVKIEDAQPGDF